MGDTATLGARRATVRAEFYTSPRTPADGPPDDVREVVVWQEVDGTEITDLERIAELEARLQQREDQHHGE